MATCANRSIHGGSMSGTTSSMVLPTTSVRPEWGVNAGFTSMNRKSTIFPSASDTVSMRANASLIELKSIRYRCSLSSNAFSVRLRSVTSTNAPIAPYACPEASQSGAIFPKVICRGRTASYPAAPASGSRRAVFPHRAPRNTRIRSQFRPDKRLRPSEDVPRFGVEAP